MRIRVFIAGHRGLVGSAFVRAFKKNSDFDIITREKKELDLRSPLSVNQFFSENRPDWVVLAAARVGSIQANLKFPAEFLIDNLKIQNNVIEASHAFDVKKLIYFGSNCMYPAGKTEPMSESDLLAGPPEATNQAYAFAKIAGWKLCEAYNQQYGTNFFTLIPASVIGLNDNYDLNRAHVVPALIRRFHEAKMAGQQKVIIWGSGKPLRQFIWSDDLANFGVRLFQKELDAKSIDALNVASKIELSISEISEVIQRVVHPNSEIVFDLNKADGVFRKNLNCAKAFTLGLENSLNFEIAIRSMYANFK